jgi:peptide-methionine (R)-S-oxide reductase
MKQYILFLLACVTISCDAQTTPADMSKEESHFPVTKTDQEWKSMLTPEEYYVLREKGTERPFTGTYNVHFEEGMYNCRACDAPLFSSDSKFDGHCGWPSFDAGIASGAVIEKQDKTLGMSRTEILCGGCGGHLGHVFNDGPSATGLRYCVNSLSISFDEDTKKEGE